LFRTERKGHAGCRRAGDDVDLFKGAVKILRDDTADLLSFIEVGIVKACGERIGPYKDASLDFFAETFAT